MELLTLSSSGLYSPAADIYIDPWSPVDRAIITHGHGDHARSGSGSYLTAARGRRILELRLLPGSKIETLQWDEAVTMNGVRISLHPAGHILGSAQVRLEHQGQVAVVSGDYKVEPDVTCDAFEPVRCHLFVTESTFGLPIYRWRRSGELFGAVDEWWRANQSQELTSVIFAYSLGKAQRVLAGLQNLRGPIAVHGSITRLNTAYEHEGVKLPPSETLNPENIKAVRGKGLVVAPPSARNTPWLRKLAPFSAAVASGWMTVRGQRRRHGVDRGFPISDHADWPGLLGAIEATGATTVWVTHGSTEPFARHLRERGLDASALKTHFHPETEEGEVSESVDGELSESAVP